MKMRSLALSACILAFVIAGFATRADAATVNIKIGHGVPENTSMHYGFTQFKEMIEARSPDFKVEIYPNQQLGGDRELTEALQMNNVSMTAVSGNNLAPFAKEFFVTDLFFIADTHEKAQAIYDSPAAKQLFGYLEPIGIKGLGAFENGFRHLTNSKRPVLFPSDLAGIKMRVPENPVQIAAWKTLGASPTPMAWGELFTALQQGTLDSQESTIESIYSMHFDEVQKYLSLSRHTYTSHVVIASLEFYENEMNDEQRAIFDECVAEAVRLQRIKARELEDDYLEQIRAKGSLEIVEFGEENTAAFRALMDDVNKIIKERCGADIYDAFTAEIEKHR